MTEVTIDSPDGVALPRVVRDDKGKLWTPPDEASRRTMKHADLIAYAQRQGATFEFYSLTDRGWLTPDGRVVYTSDPEGHKDVAQGMQHTDAISS